MKFPSNIKLFGDEAYRGDCPTESMEQVTFFTRLRKKYPNSWGIIAFHPRNEGKRSWVKAAIEKAEGMVKGTSDVIIPGNPSFVCEIKRKDHTKSKWQDGQQEFLNAAKEAGSFVCIALGADAAEDAFRFYLGLQNAPK
jgi:hypothetical protein